jgi:hypothetical protein
MMIRSLRRLAMLCLATTAFLSFNAGAAVKLSEQFDNAYFSNDSAGRGILVRVVPLGDGSHSFFAAIFTYNDAGEPVWLILSKTFLEHQFEDESVPVLVFSGGSFGGTFPPLAGTQVGVATVRVNDCNSIYFNLDMNEGSGFPDAELGDLIPTGVNKQCVYQREFTGCPAFATEAAGIPRACVLSGVYNTQDITLTNEVTWILSGLVRIGDDNANSINIFIEPGTVIIGDSETLPYLYVSPGSKIFANGTPTAPIVLTSGQDGFDPAFDDPQPGDLGGLVVSGNAPVNACPTAPFNCFSEFDQTQRYGGNNATESSGEISYFQVRYAGIEFEQDAEVNSFTFQGVGSGTTVHHLQAYRGQDDGIEFFGGTVNVKFMLVTEGGDDAVDWDLGYSGNLQYGMVWHGNGFGEDYGIEGASNPDSFDVLPRATPTLSNYTFLGNGNGDSGILFKDGSGGRIFNTIVDGFNNDGGCIEFDDAPNTYQAAGTPENPNTDNTAFNGVIINCDVDFVDDPNGEGTFLLTDFFNSSSFSGNADTDPMLNGYLPMPGSPALSGGVPVPGNQFFDQTAYRGGFNGRDDWTGFGHQVTGGQ